MLTTGSKWFFGLAAFFFVAALVYGGATNPDEVGMDTITGVLTLGYKGGVGDHLGYAILLGLSGACLFLGAVSSAFRDADPEAQAEVLEREAVPEVEAPQRGSYWPVVASFGVGFVAVGLVTVAPLVWLGIIVLLAVAFEWAITAWSERATGDPEVNAAIRRRVMMPIEVPVIGALGVALLVISVSRILLAVPKLGVYLIFGLVPLLVLIIGVVLATRPSVNPTVVAVLCVLGALGILVGGVVSAAVGPREIEHHDEEEEHSGAPASAPGDLILLPGRIR